MISPFVIFLSDPHTLPPWVFDVSNDVNRVALSLEPRSEIYAPSLGELLSFSTSPCFTYLNHPLSTLWECYCEENLNRSITYDNDHFETQKGATLRYGKIITAPLYKQGLTLLLLLRPFNYRYQKLIDNKLAFLQTY